MAFNHKRADFWLPNLGFKRSLLSLLNGIPLYSFILEKVVEYFTKFMIFFLTEKVECLFYTGFYSLLDILTPFRQGVECGLLGRRSMHNLIDRWPRIVDG